MIINNAIDNKKYRGNRRAIPVVSIFLFLVAEKIKKKSKQKNNIAIAGKVYSGKLLKIPA